jgi:hypothetical protein
MFENEINENKPEEVSFDDAKQVQQLKDLLSKKAKEKLQIQNLPGLNILKKSKFYFGNNKELREHIASYNGYAIMIKQERIKEDINDKEVQMFPSLVTLEDLRKMKKVNGNIIRKMNPNSIHEWEKMALIQGVVIQIDNGLKE